MTEGSALCRSLFYGGDLMLDDLKLLLGISGTDQDNLLELLLRYTQNKVLADINQSVLPKAAEGLVVEITFDAYMLHRQATGADAGEITGSVNSVSDNGQSVSYREGAYNGVLKTLSDDFLKNYASRLETFRRPRW